MPVKARSKSSGRKRASPKPHTRKLASGKTIKVNHGKGIKVKSRMAAGIAARVARKKEPPVNGAVHPKGGVHLTNAANGKHFSHAVRSLAGLKAGHKVSIASAPNHKTHSVEFTNARGKKQKMFFAQKKDRLHKVKRPKNWDDEY